MTARENLYPTLFPLHRAFIELIGLSRYLYLRFKSRDDIDLFIGVVRNLNRDINSVVEELAAKLNQSYLFNVPTFDPCHLPRGLSMRDLHQLNIAPIFEGDEIVALCGLNHSRLLQKFPWFSSLPFYVSDPYTVAAALEGAVSAFHESRGTGDPRFCEALLQRVLEFADREGANEVQLAYQKSALQYRLLRDGRTLGQGEICKSVSARVKEFCERVCASHDAFFNSGAARVFVLRHTTEGMSLIVRDKGGMVEALQSESEKGGEENGSGTRKQSSAPHRELLVVEDDKDFLRVLERYLNRFGFKVLSATNGLEAIHVLQSMSVPPAAVISDVHMPLLDGFALVERIGKSYVGPIIHLTSDESTELEVQALNRGAVAVISKSRDPRILLAHLNRVCGISTVKPT